MKAFAQLLMATGLMVTATAASAHAGHDAGTGFTSGLLHPMLGLDHLLAMAAIGFWSVRQSATLKNRTPLFVIGGMVVGAGIAWGGLSLPGVETGISLSNTGRYPDCHTGQAADRRGWFTGCGVYGVSRFCPWY